MVVSKTNSENSETNDEPSYSMEANDGDHQTKIRGKVKWFNNAKGYGFIIADNSDEDLFAHFSAVVMDGYRTLKAGQTVEFNIRPSIKGNHAIDIEIVVAEGIKSVDTIRERDSNGINQPKERKQILVHQSSLQSNYDETSKERSEANAKKYRDAVTDQTDLVAELDHDQS